MRERELAGRHAQLELDILAKVTQFGPEVLRVGWQNAVRVARNHDLQGRTPILNPTG